jgi:hypothetical protein
LVAERAQIELRADGFDIQLLGGDSYRLGPGGCDLWSVLYGWGEWCGSSGWVYPPKYVKVQNPYF